jgi:hypothetical protein
MGGVRNTFRALLAASLCVLLSFAEAGAQEKEISFNKDISVVPVNESEAKIRINLSVDKARVNPGDTVTVHFEPDKDCYLTLIDVGTSGKITRLWPNQFSGGDNFVRAHTRLSFPGSSDKFVFRVSGPEGIERIVAVASTKKNAIIREEEFSDYKGGFKSYQKSLKDLVVEAVNRSEGLPENVNWGTAEAKLVIGNVPDGGRITSRNVYVVSIGAATAGLQYCDQDAKGFGRLLAQKLSVPRDNVRILLGRQATRRGFVEAIRWLSSKTQPEDLVFVYFSGHGTLIPDEPPVRHPDGLSSAFVCYNTKQRLRIEDPALKDILLTGPDFANMMKRVPARRRLIVVDSCHSGSITKEMSARLVSKYLPLLSPEEIRRIRTERQKELHVVSSGSTRAGYDDAVTEEESLLAACAKPESSYEDRSKQAGLFTYWLVNNIKGRARDLQTAFEETRRNVLDETSSLSEPQTPQITDEYGLARDIRF